MVKILKLLLVLLVCLPLAAQSQTASLVVDVGRTGGEESHSYPGPFMTLRGQAFFSAEEPGTGREMWVSDGTAAGTELLVDACPGECPSNPQLLGSGGGGMFWAATTSTSRTRLWWSDGTRAGTRMLQGDDLDLSLPDGEHASSVFVGGTLYVLGCGRSEGCGLWKSDGTEEGTRPVVPDSPWQSGSLSGLQAVGSTLFFLAEDREGPFRFGLWKTDGTEAGTVRVQDLEIYLRVTAATASRFFFVTRVRGGESTELWASDGTEAGTQRLASFPDAPSSSFEIPWLKPVGNRVYFLANDVVHGWEVWRSDGTPEGTEAVTSFGFYTPFEGGASPWQLEELGNRVVFLASDGLSGVKLWAATGPEGRPAALAEICPEESCDFIDSDWRLVKVGNRVVFRGTDAAHGREIWSTDGTVSGTRLLSDVCPGPCGGAVAEPVLSGSAAWFATITRQGNPHLELWRTDGTEAGTRRFIRLETTWFLDELLLATAGKKIFFMAGDEHGLEPWVSDGTPGGSGMIADIAREDPGSAPSELTPLGNALVWNVCLDGFDGFLYRTGGTPETTEAIFESEWGTPCDPGELFAAAQKVFFVEDAQLWATDGTPGGAVQLTELDPFNDQYLGGAFAEHQGRLYFPVSNAGTTEIWRSDGTPAGTEKVLEIPEGGGIYRLTSLGSELYFMTTDNLGGFQVWKSDGTAAGTRRLTDEPVSFNPGWNPQFVRLGGAVFFAGAGLWKTNGTPQGTERVSALSGSGNTGITDLQVFSGALYFFAWTSEGERALWRSDGTTAGTGIVKRFVSDFDAARAHLTAFEGRLYFAANDGVHGRELWTSDGTAAGTTLVRDIRPGPEPSWPASLVAAGGKLYFRADDGLNGTELWESDGTAAGTRLRQDIHPGARSSRPEELTVAGGRLYFSANDGVTGRELWALPLDGPGGCQPSPTVLCLANGRFRVEAVWKDFENRTGAGRAVALTADTGYFWFFDASNVEVVLKVLDGRGVNGHHWVFYGALSSVEYSITVTDTVTGASRRYFNPTGRLGSVGHTEAFGPRGAFSRFAAGSEAPPPIVTKESAKAGACVPSATRLCLNGGRFAVESAWKDFSGNMGTGKAVQLTGDTGYFWFFDDDNVELVLKVLDGRPVNQKFWVFYGALSSVEYTITVTDTVTGQKKTYRNPSGRLASVADTAAF